MARWQDLLAQCSVCWSGFEERSRPHPPRPAVLPNPAVRGDMREQECLRCQQDREILLQEERSRASLRRARSASGLTLLREASDREFVVPTKVCLISVLSKYGSDSARQPPLSQSFCLGSHEPKVTAQYLHGYSQMQLHIQSFTQP